jgi:hypothetical protein
LYASSKLYHNKYLSIMGLEEFIGKMYGTVAKSRPECGERKRILRTETHSVNKRDEENAKGQLPE